MDKRRALTVVACLGLAIALVSVTAGTATADDEIEGFDFGYSGSIHGLEAGEFVALWGNTTGGERIDFAANTTVERTRIDKEGASPSTLRTFVARTETAEAPVDLAQEWNSVVLDSSQVVNKSDNNKTSVYPASANPGNYSMIKDAHTTIFTTTPSTIVHDGEEPTRYINESGSISSLTDFRPEEPDYDPGFEDDDVVTDVDITSTRKEASINNTSLIVDGKVVNATENTRTAVLEYEEIDPDTEELTVESELQAEYEVRVETTTERTYDLGMVKLSEVGSVSIDDLTDVQNYVSTREEADADYGQTIGVEIIDIDSSFGISHISDPGFRPGDVQAQGAASLGSAGGQTSNRGEKSDRETKREKLRRGGTPGGSGGGGGGSSGGSDDDDDDDDDDDGDDDPFVDLGSVTIQYTAVKYETVENEVTVGDSVDVEVYDPEEPEIVVGNARDGADYVQIQSEDPIAGYTIENGINSRVERVRYGWNFYTARDTGWDNTTVSTGNNETSGQSVLNPVEVNAAPAKTASVTPSSAATEKPDITYESRGELKTGLIPPGARSESDTYTFPKRAVTPHTAEIDGGITINGIVRGSNRRIESDEIDHVEIRPVEIETEEADGETGPIVDVTVKDGVTGDPIPGSELEGTVVAASGIRETEIGISEDGTGQYEMVTYGNGEVRYEPAPWGEADTPRSSARETFAISQFTDGDAFVRLIEQVIYFLVIPFLIVRRVGGVMRDWIPPIE